MSILRYLPYFNRQPVHVYVAQEIVDTCLPILTSDLQETTGAGTSGSAEYRGYVRARASWLVDNAVDEVMEEFQVQITCREAICSLAVERLIGYLVEECAASAA